MIRSYLGLILVLSCGSLCARTHVDVGVSENFGGGYAYGPGYAPEGPWYTPGWYGPGVYNGVRFNTQVDFDNWHRDHWHHFPHHYYR